MSNGNTDSVAAKRLVSEHPPNFPVPAPRLQVVVRRVNGRYQSEVREETVNRQGEKEWKIALVLDGAHVANLNSDHWDQMVERAKILAGMLGCRVIEFPVGE